MSAVRLSLLGIPICPNCSQPVDPRDLRREFFRRRSPFSETRYGLECPTCHQILKLKRWRSYALGLVLYPAAIVTPIAAARHLPPLDHDSELILFLACGAAYAAVYFLWAPRLAMLERPAPDEQLVAGRSFEANQEDDPQYREYLRELDEQNEWVEQVNSPRRSPWRCTACGEENPETFDICWKCGGPRQRE